jgi:hypothetical protein
MGNVVALRPGDPGSLNCPSLPNWPHPRNVTLTIEQCRAIDRDRRHLDAVMERVRDVTAISTMLSTICGDRDDGITNRRAARAIGRWLATGRT